jgi:hypothetical protein
MRKPLILLTILAGVLIPAVPVCAQETVFPQIIRSQEVDDEGVAVLVKHLPDWRSARQRATFTNKLEDVSTALGERPALLGVEFVPGTEAVIAPYDAGKLLLIEYPSPQASVDTDTRVTQYLASSGDGSVAYRRIGNYNAFVFDVSDPAAANALLDQIKYEKSIRWLGEDPFYQNRAERSFVVTTSDIFLSTVLVIVLGMGTSILAGLGFGIVYFMFRERRRAGMSEYSDAGGMTRLNLDHLTPDIAGVKLLSD